MLPFHCAGEGGACGGCVSGPPPQQRSRKKLLTEAVRHCPSLGGGGGSRPHQVALKFLSKENLLKRQTRMVRVKREIRILKLLNHPNIVRLFDVAETDKEIILTMEYAGGGELFDYIVAHSRLKEREARRIFRQILSAIAYCHENCIIHRDLKPENILLDNDRNVKVIGTASSARARGQGPGGAGAACAEPNRRPEPRRQHRA